MECVLDGMLFYAGLSSLFTQGGMLVLCTLAVIAFDQAFFASVRREKRTPNLRSAKKTIEGVNGGDGKREPEMKEGSFIPLPFSLSAFLLPPRLGLQQQLALKNHSSLPTSRHL